MKRDVTDVSDASVTPQELPVTRHTNRNLFKQGNLSKLSNVVVIYK